MSVPFKSASFKTAGGTTARSLDDWFSDIINVKDMGAVGNGIADDTDAIQAAFDLAFGSPPNGWNNRHLNRPVFFPAGVYNIDIGLTITKAVGGHIYGAGKHSTTLYWTGAIGGGTGGVFTPMLTLNGCADLCMEKMSLNIVAGNLGGDNTCALFINWDGDDSGNGCDGSHDNHFQEMSFGTPQYGIVIGRAGVAISEGHSNLFLNCTVGGDVVRCATGFEPRGPSSDNNQIIGGGGISFSVSYVRCPSGGGQIHAQGVSIGGNAPDFIMESDKVMYISQTRTESAGLLRMENGIVTLHAVSATDQLLADGIEINGGKCIIQGCALHPTGQISGTGGELYLAANYFQATTPLSGYSGTVVWNPDGVT